MDEPAPGDIPPNGAKRQDMSSSGVARQAQPAESGDREAAIRQHDRDLYEIRHPRDVRCGLDLLIFVVIALVIVAALAAGWIFWMLIMSSPARHASADSALLLPTPVPLASLLSNYLGWVG